MMRSAPPQQGQMVGSKSGRLLVAATAAGSSSLASGGGRGRRMVASRALFLNALQARDLMALTYNHTQINDPERLAVHVREGDTE